MTNGADKQTTDYTQCYVAFIDILGFKELVRQSVTSMDLRSVLVSALKQVASLPSTQHSRCDFNYHKDGTVTASPRKHWSTQIRAFSDSVVIFIPVETDGLSDVLFKVRYLHDRLFELHCCIRGAVTIGEMYWEDTWSSPRGNVDTGDTTGVSPATLETVYERERPSNGFITLGPGLVEAYKLESEVAIYPRVIFSPDLIAHINTMAKTKPENGAEGVHKAAHAVFLCSPTPANRARCVTDFICEDADGVPFLDLFHNDIDRNDTKRIEREIFANGRTGLHWIDDDMTHDKFMIQARIFITEQLEIHRAEKVRAKYLWLAKYFNRCISHPDILPLPAEWSSPNG